MPLFDPVSDELDAPTRAEADSSSAKVDLPRHDWRGTARYQVVRLLGEGGMGTVYEVFDRDAQRSLALKTLQQANPASIYRFKQEFRTLADVQHPNLVHLYEFVASESGDVFFTMELVQGTNFLHYVRGATGRVDYDRLRCALRQLVEGIMALHSAGKLHRDIKPSNVLVTDEGRVVIVDFGVAAELATDPGHSSGELEVVGTAAYMAPEQASRAAPHPTSDWYSVGVMLYAALVGARPFVGSTQEIIARKRADDPIPPSQRGCDVPADLESLCMALLSRVPEQRPTGAEILRRIGGSPDGLNEGSLARMQTGTALLGREKHLQALAAALEATGAGQIAVFASGLSGMGKSALIRQFLDEQMLQSDALVLRGRAYERESVPFKAVDAIVDALSLHLVRSARAGEPVRLPADIGVVAKVFPVFGRVPGFPATSKEVELDPMRLRRRAFVALRELIASAAARGRLILYVDDASRPRTGDISGFGSRTFSSGPGAAPRPRVSTRKLHVTRRPASARCSNELPPSSYSPAAGSMRVPQSCIACSRKSD